MSTCLCWDGFLFYGLLQCFQWHLCHCTCEVFLFFCCFLPIVMNIIFFSLCKIFNYIQRTVVSNYVLSKKTFLLCVIKFPSITIVGFLSTVKAVFESLCHIFLISSLFLISSSFRSFQKHHCIVFDLIILKRSKSGLRKIIEIPDYASLLFPSLG